MKRILVFFCLLLTQFALLALQRDHESVPIHIEVPVTIIQGNNSVNDLIVDDFEIYENGLLQQIDAVYFVSQRRVERRTERKRFSPNVNRNFYLFFELSEYTSAVGDAVEFFVKDIMHSGDLLTVVTPIETYRLRKNALEIKSRYEVISQLKGILRKDVERGSAEYRETIQQLSGLATSLASTASQPDPEQLILYSDLLEHLKTLGQVDDELLLEIAKYLSEERGQKFVFLFYQHEDTPRFTPDTVRRLREHFQTNPAVTRTLSAILEMYNQEVAFDVKRVIQAYADSSIAINFLIVPDVPQKVPGINFVPRADGIFLALTQIINPFGGVIERSSDPSEFLLKSLTNSENYYLLYYSPQNIKLNGEFRQITVRVKNQALKVFHRKGYYAD